MLQSRIQRPIPERLSHYTNLEALKSILSDQAGKGICLRAFSNRCKNDDQEIRMGEYMLKRVREVLPTNASLLNQFGGYENSASFSFNEGDVNKHMLEYGNYRLEFDLREIGTGLLSDGIVNCEYVAENNLKEYADEYSELIANTFNAIPALQKKYGKISPPPIDYLMYFIQMEQDIMGKVFCLKEQQWSEEREWRKVMPLNDNTNIHYHNSKPFVEYYLDKKYLTGITVFCSHETLVNAQKDAGIIRDYISVRDYRVTVNIEIVDSSWLMVNG